MNKLNTIQKIAILISGLFLIVSSIFSLYLALPTFKIRNIKQALIIGPISVTSSNVDQQFYYQDEISLNDGDNRIRFNNNTFITNSSILLDVISINKLNIGEGNLVYFDIQNEITIAKNTNKILLKPGNKGVFNYNDGSIILLSGTNNISNNIVLNPNQIAKWKVDNYLISSFERNTLATVDFQSLISSIKSFNIAAGEIENISKPKINKLSPVDQTSTSDDFLTLSGIIDPSATLKINNLNVFISQTGGFNQSISLNLGKNTINLVLTDKYGNQSMLVNTYYKDTNNSNCNVGNISDEIGCKINMTRTNKNISDLKIDTILNNVSYNHSLWMSTNNSLSHLESDGNTYTNRCSSAFTSCSYEIILKLDNLNVSDILTTLNSSNYTTYLLNPAYTKLGIGIYDNYLTILFK